MSRVRVAAASVVIVLSLGMVRACPAVAAGGGLAGKSAQQVVSIALSAGEAKGSVRITFSGDFGGAQGTAIFDQTKTEGREVDSGGPGFANYTVLMIKRVLYAEGDATFLYGLIPQTQVTTFAGKWIAFHEGDQSYNYLVTDELLVQNLKDSLPVAPYSTPEFTTLNGKKVVKIVGGIRKSLRSSGGGTDTAYISAGPPYFPVASVFYNLAPPTNGGPATLYDVTATFSKWGEKVSLSPPSNPTSASSILGS